MIKELRHILAAVVVLLGVGLIVGGIATGKHGAVVIGLCVAAMAVQQMIVIRNRNGQHR